MVAPPPRVWPTPSTNGLLAWCPAPRARPTVAVMTRTATRTGSVRTLVARHPVPSMIIVMLAVAFALLTPPTLAGWAPEPFLLATVVFAQLVPAVLVTAAVDGRAGVRDLVRRIFRWRVHPAWYAVAFLALPAAALLVALAFGVEPTTPVLAAYLAQLAVLPLVNLWEETAVMGVIQARLTASRGPVVAAVVTGLVFGLYHLPLQLGQPIGDVAFAMAVIFVAAVAFRFVAGWLYAGTGGSILLVAGLHATFNAVNGSGLPFVIGPALVVVGALGLIAAGRFSRA
jgi:membrane protease YdiL (CAAX protease family)